MPGVLASDHFHGVMGSQRGSVRPDDPAGVLAAYRALSDGDLALCVELVGDDSTAGKLLLAGVRDRTVLDALPDDSFVRLRARREKRLHQQGIRYREDELCARLQACSDARLTRWELALAARGGRPMGMYTDDGNVAVSRLVDRVLAAPAGDRVRLLQDGAREVASVHREIGDTAVRERIAEDLQAGGADPELIGEL